MLSKACNFTRLQCQLKTTNLVGAARCFGAPTKELQENLKTLGIKNKNIVHNPT